MMNRVISAKKGKRLIGMRFEKDMEAFVLELCGGGYTANQTMTAIVACQLLRTTGKASVGKIKLELLNGEAQS